VPTEHGVWLHEQHGALPPARDCGEADDDGALVGPELGSLDVSLGDDQLLAEKGVFSNELVARANDVGDEAEGEARARPE
jgi:hypothetical protein